MSRRRRTPVRRVAVPIEQLTAIVERPRRARSADDQATLQAAVGTLARLTEELETTTTTLERVRLLILGPRTETTATVLGRGTGDPAEIPASPADPASAAEPTPTEPERKPPTPGHGRNGAAKYPRAPRIHVTHDTLKHGDPCPEPGCSGRVYVQRQESSVLVRVTGVAPLSAQVYTLERLRYGLCGTVFTAAPPPGSTPRMKALHDWMAKQFAEHLVEPNSGLGQAITYMQNHWEKLTFFLRVAGAPLSKNICERALKKAILHLSVPYAWHR